MLQIHSQDIEIIWPTSQQVKLAVGQVLNDTSSDKNLAPQYPTPIIHQEWKNETKILLFQFHIDIL